MRKILHLFNKKTCIHKYYGSVVAMCHDNTFIKYHNIKKYKFDELYEDENCIIRLGFLLTPSQVKINKNNK